MREKSTARTAHALNQPIDRALGLGHMSFNTQ